MSAWSDQDRNYWTNYYVPLTPVIYYMRNNHLTSLATIEDIHATKRRSASISNISKRIYFLTFINLGHGPAYAAKY